MKPNLSLRGQRLTFWCVAAFGVAGAFLFLVGIPLQTVFIDEPWLGEYAFRHAETGRVHTYLFGDFLGYEQAVLVYHKLYILAGSLVTQVFGFHLVALRMIGVCATAGTFLLLYRATKADWRCQREEGVEPLPSARERVEVLLILAFILFLAPRFFLFSRMYRAEPLQTFFAVWSFCALLAYFRTQQWRPLLICAVMAGASALTHPNGLMALGGGGTALLFCRRWKALAVFCAVGLATCTLFLFDVHDFGLLAMQFKQDPALEPSDFSLMKCLLGPIHEHRRFFHDKEVAGLSILFVLALFTRRKAYLREEAASLFYIAGTIVALGFLAQRNLGYTKYTLPVAPMLAWEISKPIYEMTRGRIAAKRKLLAVTGALLLLTYAGIGLKEATLNTFDRRPAPSPAENARVAERLERNTRIIAPLSFVFNEAGNFEILTYYHINRKLDRAGRELTGDNLFTVAAEEDARYVILGDDIQRRYGHPLPWPVTRDTHPYRLLFRHRDTLVYERISALARAPMP